MRLATTHMKYHVVSVQQIFESFTDCIVQVETGKEHFSLVMDSPASKRPTKGSNTERM